jgi:hypothetical protein
MFCKKKKDNTMSSVYCLVQSHAQASRIADRLRVGGFSANDVSALFPNSEQTRAFAHQNSTKTPEGAAIGAGTGALLGGTLGWLAGIGTLAVPGVGPLIAAGPIMALLAGAAAGGAAGGLAGALIGMGVPEYEAKTYEGKVREGNILIAVHTDTSEEAARAREIFSDEKAESISTGPELTTPAHRDRP